MQHSLLSGVALFALLQATPVLAQEQTTAAPATANEQSVELDTIIVTATKRARNLQDVPIAISAVGSLELKTAGISDVRELQRLSPSLLLTSTSAEAAGTTARIRGIGTTGDNPGLESSVAVIIDGVYRNRNSVSFTDLGEIERIEVARGPQGTLFGRNASAGLINVVTKGPSYDAESYAEASYGNFDYVRVAVGATGAIINDKLAVRLDGSWTRRNGFFEDILDGAEYNDRHRWLVRGQLLFEPTENLTFRLIGDYAQRREQCCAAATIVRGPSASVIETLGGQLGSGAGGLSSSDPYDRDSATTQGRSAQQDVNEWGVSNEATLKLGGVTLTSLTSYRFWDYNRGQDIDYTTLDLLYRSDDLNAQRFRTFQQELRAQGEAFGGRLDWLVGGIFANEILNVEDENRTGADFQRYLNALLNRNVPPSAPQLLNPLNTVGSLARAFGIIPATSNPADLFSSNDTFATFRHRSRNFAVFTHNEFKITDQLTFTAGVRYTNENKEIDANLTGQNLGCTATFGISNLTAAQLAPAVGGITTANALLAGARGLVPLACSSVYDPRLNGAYTSSRQESEVTGTAVLGYKVNDEINTYASYARGYKAGGFNLDRAGLTFPGVGVPIDADQLQFPAETVNSYEVGLKYRNADNGATVNVALFYEDFSNFQLNTFNGLAFIVSPIAGVVSKGFEIEGGFKPARSLNINGGITVADARYDDNLEGPLFAQPTSATLPAGNTLFQLPGARLTNAPLVTITSSATWRPQISEGLDGLFNLNLRYSSKYNTGSDLDPEKTQLGFVVVNARAGISDPDGKWALEFFAQNLFNKNYTQVAFDAPFQEPGGNTIGNPFVTTSNQTFNAFLGEPRTFGVTLKGRF
ncbi:MAG: TonB-dependent receptor [Sphingomonadales bacterium]|nr:MAG: TonB-dependent receptor [Sphingomonadales bacterium]